MLMIILIVLGGLLVIALVSLSIFWILIQLGVIVQKAAEPPTTDTNDYRLNQGRDVGKHE